MTEKNRQSFSDTMLPINAFMIIAQKLLPLMWERELHLYHTKNGSKRGGKSRHSPRDGFKVSSLRQRVLGDRKKAAKNVNKKDLPFGGYVCLFDRSDLSEF